VSYSQSDLILFHMMDGSTLTSLEALKKFGCFRLAARIGDLKKDGHKIQKRTITVNKKKIAQYRIHPRDLRSYE